MELKKAKWENERIMKGEPVNVSPYDVAAIHLPCHTQKIQDPVFLENSTPEQFQALNAHIQAHTMAEQQKAMMAQQQAMLAQQEEMRGRMVQAGAKAPPPGPEGMPMPQEISGPPEAGPIQ